MNTSEPRLLVTGTGGKLGSAIVRYLAAAGTSNVIAASRRPEALSVPSRFETRRVDFDDTASLVSAFAGVERALIISTDRIDAPGLRIEQQIAAVEAARAAGVRHLLYTSMPNPDRSLIPFAADHLETEKAIARSGAGFTILRVSWYTDNLLATLASALASGTWYTAAGNGRINYVPRDDVARAAAAALASRSDVRERLDITGPEPLSISEIAAIAAKLGAAPIEVVQVPDEQRAEGARAAGVPEAFVPIVAATDANIRAGNFDIASAAVEDLTGAPATSVEAFLAANKICWQP
jgi:NAD(P)H dehydrogenase (quinone)